MIREVTTPEDEMTGKLRYYLGNSRYVMLDVRDVREVGLSEALKHAGVDIRAAPDRLPVKRSGKVIGTVCGDFDPRFVKSTSMFYTPRRGDFLWRGDHWEADKTLCPGDFEAIPGFVWQREDPS